MEMNRTCHENGQSTVCPAKLVLRWTLEGKRKWGRHKETWRRMVGQLKEMGMKQKEAEKKARDKQIWWQLISVLCGDMHKVSQGLNSCKCWSKCTFQKKS